MNFVLWGMCCDWLTSAYDWLMIFRRHTIVTLSYIIRCYYIISDYDVTLSVGGVFHYVIDERYYAPPLIGGGIKQ